MAIHPRWPIDSSAGSCCQSLGQKADAIHGTGVSAEGARRFGATGAAQRGNDRCGVGQDSPYAEGENLSWRQEMTAPKHDPNESALCSSASVIESKGTTIQDGLDTLATRALAAGGIIEVASHSPL